MLFPANLLLMCTLVSTCTAAATATSEQTQSAKVSYLILLVFLVQIAIHLVNTIGGKTFNDLLWQLSARLPLASSQKAKQQIQLRTEVVRLKREMNKISAQDDFARWAKVRREHDKVLGQHDTVASQVQESRASFDSRAGILRWVSTSGLRFFLQWWYGKTPVFNLPPGWFPWYVEWVLGFPRCPYGGVSINIWFTACATVIALVGDMVTWTFVQYIGQSSQKTKQKAQVTPAKKKS